MLAIQLVWKPEGGPGRNAKRGEVCTDWNNVATGMPVWLHVTTEPSWQKRIPHSRLRWNAT